MFVTTLISNDIRVVVLALVTHLAIDSVPFCFYSKWEPYCKFKNVARGSFQWKKICSYHSCLTYVEVVPPIPIVLLVMTVVTTTIQEPWMSKAVIEFSNQVKDCSHFYLHESRTDFMLIVIFGHACRSIPIVVF